MPLSPQESKALNEALVDAFDAAHLERMLAFGPGWQLDRIAGRGPLTDMVFEVVEYAKAHGAISTLILAAQEANPGNPALRAFVAAHPHLTTSAQAPAPATATPAPPAEQVPYEFSRAALIELLIKIPAAQSANGRRAFLQGIPGADALNREDSSVRLDLTLIVDQVAGLGQLDSGALPLVMLIDNALPFAAPGTRTHSDLEAMRDSLKASAPGT